MQHLRRAQTTAKPLLSLATYFCDLAASQGYAAAGVRSQSYFTCGVISAQQALLRSPPAPFALSEALHTAAACSPAYCISSRGFAGQAVSRLKKTVTRAKRIAQQQHGGRSGPVSDQLDPTSNEAVATIPQESSTVQASQSSATHLQVTSLKGNHR